MVSCENRSFVAIFLLLSIGVFCISAFSISSIKNLLQIDSSEKDVVFRLYTPEFPVNFVRLNASDSKSISGNGFNPKRPTVFFTHGYKSKEKVILRYKEAYLKMGDYNFIGVDWIDGAATINYLAAKAYVPFIAEKLANLLDTLVADHGLRLKDTLIIGHSLGAHISGRAAKLLKSKDKVGCIVGLDPAGVNFDVADRANRLDRSDAEYVQVIHTDGDKFGMMDPIGHADFYPNAGKDQPGCPQRNMLMTWVEKCSHVRAHHLFLESLITEVKAVHCGSLQEIQRGICSDDKHFGIMGGDVLRRSPKPIGIFYLETKTEPPYVITDPAVFKKHKSTLETYTMLEFDA